ncbi:MAG: hypothetical protein RIS09_61 [Actinomycetota bacterium]|jgi:adenine phosphoribosyltransferase
MFQDLTGVLADAKGLKEVTEDLARPFQSAGIDLVAGMEARGFIVGTSVARALNVGFLAMRKAGKLPGDVHQAVYTLEYGEATLEVHKEDIKEGMKVLVIDDVLATGGTALAAAQLIERAHAHVVGFGFVLDLTFLGGRDKLKNYNVHSLKSITA